MPPQSPTQIPEDPLEDVDRTRDPRSEHEEIQRATLKRESSRAISLLQQHYMRTVQTLLDNWTELP